MNIVITGASKGIGYATALAMANKTFGQLVLVSRSKAKLEQLKTECLKINPEMDISIVVVDIKELTSSAENINKYFTMKKIDVLINNAGFLVNKPFEEISHSDISDMVNINYGAPLLLIQGLLEKLKSESISHVLNISSMGGYQGSSKFPGLSVYSSTKAAIASLTECLATEYADTNIKFNCLALGAVQTEMLEAAFPGYNAPLSAKEMGEYIADFALNGCKYFNGKILPVSVTNP